MEAFESKKRRRPVRKPAPRRKVIRAPRQAQETKAPPRLHKEARTLLQNIGRPAPEPFRPDPFQVEAVKLVLRTDVVVSAPTGSGKTWIALEATRKALARRQRVWYATPLKALSNAKYAEFGEALGGELVGILTGDRKENPDAPVIVGTTEILRNQLYDSMQEGRDLDVDLVILDEAHYLGDPDRGVVWEEVLIYLPSRVRLLLLSATIPNAREIARWLAHIRGTACEVVESRVRPVPLHVLFLTPDGHVTPFLRGARLHSEAAEIARAARRRKKTTHEQEIDIPTIVDTLRQFDLLPAIVFLKSRAECDRALRALEPSPTLPDEDGFVHAVEKQIGGQAELENHKQLSQLLYCRAGSHHAGQLPGWRLLIERMMVLGYIEVIFSTSTVAAGVNFPARTVVLLQSDRFNGRSFVDMTATDLHQMSGRAGRRGMDNVGFMLVIPGKHLDIPLVKELVLSEPEPLKSRITVNFSMVLNLLLSHDLEGIEQLLRLSFGAFHESPKRAEKAHTKLLRDFYNHLSLLGELGYIEDECTPTEDGKWAAQLRLDHPLLIAELIRSGEYSGRNAQDLAALIAPFATDKEKEVLISRPLWEETRHLWNRFRRMMGKLKPVVRFMISRGFDPPPIMFWPAAAVYMWADGVEWEELANHVGADEGDLAMLMLRTADHLRQVRSLKDHMPELADTADEAMTLLLRSPLV